MENDKGDQTMAASQQRQVRLRPTRIDDLEFVLRAGRDPENARSTRQRPEDHQPRVVPANHTRLGNRFTTALLLAGMLGLGTACQSAVPSAQLHNAVQLPVPASAMEVPSAGRFVSNGHDEAYFLTPSSIISIAFDLQPEIKSSYHTFRSEEARYDFFYTSRDSLTPRFRSSNTYSEDRWNKEVTRTRGHRLELGVEKRFFDTTELNVAGGLRTEAINEEVGYHPFISADLRYPLWVSREKLERTSEEIFRRSELDNAQLDYIQIVRRQLEDALARLHTVMRIGREVAILQRWLDDLERLRDEVQQSRNPGGVTADRERIEAEIASVVSRVRNSTGQYEIDFERLKATCGVPFHAKVELADEPFNPFASLTHQELFRLSVETDPEIATLRNSERNAEVQSDLARRGRWDITLLLNADSDLEGAVEYEGTSRWSVSAGVDVSAVDSRVTGSLVRQAESNIARFRQAIVARENEIFVDTYEPLVRIATLGESRVELTQVLPKYQVDFEKGLIEYRAGTLNIDDLLKRRETLADQEGEISRLKFMLGVNVAELCAATGKFFELLEGDRDSSSG